MQYGYPSESHVSVPAYVWMGNMKTVQCVIEKWLIFYHEAGVLHTDTRLPNLLVFRKDDTIYFNKFYEILNNSIFKTEKAKKGVEEYQFSQSNFTLAIQPIDFDLSFVNDCNDTSAKLLVASGNRRNIMEEITCVDNGGRKKTIKI
jgi:hypothetical protein